MNAIVRNTGAISTADWARTKVCRRAHHAHLLQNISTLGKIDIPAIVRRTCAPHFPPLTGPMRFGTVRALPRGYFFVSPHSKYAWPQSYTT